MNNWKEIRDRDERRSKPGELKAAQARVAPKPTAARRISSASEVRPDLKLEKRFRKQRVAKEEWRRSRTKQVVRGHLPSTHKPQFSSGLVRIGQPPEKSPHTPSKNAQVGEKRVRCWFVVQPRFAMFCCGSADWLRNAAADPSPAGRASQTLFAPTTNHPDLSLTSPITDFLSFQQKS